MNKSTLAPTTSHKKYMDFIAPKKKPIPVGRPTSEITRKKSQPAKSASQPVAKIPVKPANSPVRPVEKPVQKSTPTPVAPTAKPLPHPKDEAPDAAKYTLGGKSPFLTSVTVEKRPLSGSAPEVPAKNVYSDAKKPSVPSKSEPTKIIKKKSKSSGGLSFLIILLTIILGAAVGVAAYYLLPK